MPNNQYVKIRIVSNQAFSLEQFNNQDKQNTTFSCLLKNEKNFFQKLFFCSKRKTKEVIITQKEDNNLKIKEVNAIIIHFHGGGFVALKSHFHQYYTRICSKDSNSPIFSVDYSLAPKHQYPVALDDCWQSYQWILKYCSNYLKIKPKKIIFIGDSAGGNFALSVSFLAFAFGLQGPDGIILAYPALSIDETKLSPSWLYYGIRNKLLPYSVIKLMLKCYLPENQDFTNDFFVSSLVADDELLKSLPPIDIICGDQDPLQDDSWRFYHRLKTLKKTVSLTFFQNIPHGFLNFDVPNGVKIGRYFVKEFSNCLQRMINL